MTEFASPNGKACFDALGAAVDGFDNTSVVEACGILLAQVIASGSHDLPSAQTRCRHIGKAMAADIATNWPLVLKRRRKRR